MNVNVNKPTERIKMRSVKYNCGDTIVCTANQNVVSELTLDREYIVQEIDSTLGQVLLSCDIGKLAWYYSSRFKLKEENVVTDQTETKQYIEHSTGLVYDLVFEGEMMNVLKSVLDNREISVHTANLYPPVFTPYTKEMQKQTKKKQDLSTLETISETVKKCLEDDYVICHSRIDRDDGLITVNIVMGKAND
jgi:hypothetical protein